MSNLIHTVDLHKSYYEGKVELPVLQGINIEIQKAEMLAIVGASGVGKSTLLHLIGALDRPTRGKIFFDNREIFTFNNRELDRFRNQEIGFVFQFHHLLPEFTAVENVALGALISGETACSAHESARKLLDYVGLSKRLGHHPSELSGGEQQRVAIARALVNEPQVILTDEPTGNLDRKTSEAVLDLLWDLNERFNQTFIIVTHNQSLARRADRVIHLIDGRISDQEEKINL